MFEPLSSRLNVRALVRDMIEEEQDVLMALGQDFLAEHLNHVDTRLNRWQRYLENHYPDGDILPRGDASKLRTYQLERALIVRLAAESQTDVFPVVHQRALKEARQRVRLLVNKRDFANPSLRTARFEARLEQELLIELGSKWHTWLQPQELRNTPA